MARGGIRLGLVAFIGTVSLVALALALAAGGVAAKAPIANAAARTVRVGLNEFSVRPKPRRTGSRSIRFRVHNAGTIRHEFVVIRTRRRASRLRIKGSRASERGRVGKIRRFGPGRTRTLRLRLRRGHYALICNLP